MHILIIDILNRICACYVSFDHFKISSNVINQYIPYITSSGYL